jgi:hypothetical protein
MPTYTDQDITRRPLPYWPTLFTFHRHFSHEVENESYLERLKRFADVGEFEYSTNDENGFFDSIYEGPKDDKEAEACSQDSNARVFMKGLAKEIFPQYRDQVELVASFYEQASKLKDFEKEHPVALLDEREYSGQNIINRGNCRPYLGPLNSRQLSEALSKKVVQTLPSHQSSPKLTLLSAFASIQTTTSPLKKRRLM